MKVIDGWAKTLELGTMRISLIASMIYWAFAFSSYGITLEEYASRQPLVIQSVQRGEAVDLGKGNQTNNLKEGGKVLLLSGRGLSSLEGISRLKVMEEGRQVALQDVPDLQIFLNDNVLTEVPQEIGALSKVTFLYCIKNPIREIPTALANMQALQGIYFTDNDIAEIPPFIFAMKQLRKLQVSKNHLKVLPPEISHLTRLIHLNLSENEIAEVPATIANLTKLRVCDLSGNRLERLPEEFGKVKILYQLRVANNPLTSLPEGFANMPGTIDVFGTSIRKEDLPEALQRKISREKPLVKPKVSEQTD